MNAQKLPTIQFSLVANDKYGSPYTVLTGRTVNGGCTSSKHPQIGLTPYDTIRAWAADALAHGATNVRLELERHTRELGWSGSERFRRCGRIYRVVQLSVAPKAFG